MGSPGKLRESPGKSAGKIFPNREMLQILGFRAPGKANLPGTLGRHCRDLVPTFRAGCFLKSTVPAFSSFSDKGEFYHAHIVYELWLAYVLILRLMLSPPTAIGHRANLALRPPGPIQNTKRNPGIPESALQSPKMPLCPPHPRKWPPKVTEIVQNNPKSASVWTPRQGLLACSIL